MVESLCEHGKDLVESLCEYGTDLVESLCEHGKDVEWLRKTKSIDKYTVCAKSPNRLQCLFETALVKIKIIIK